MQPPGRSTFTQSGLIELGKPVETLPDGRFVEAKIPKEPRKKKDALPEPPQPFVGPPPVISGAGKPRGPKERGEPQAPMQVFEAATSSQQPTTGVSQLPGAKIKKPRLVKGSQEAKDYMKAIREKGMAKKAASAPAAASAAVEAVMPKPKKGKKTAASAEPNFDSQLAAARAIKKADIKDADDDDAKLERLRKLKKAQRMAAILAAADDD